MAFFKFKTDKPEMIGFAISEMVQSDFGQGIPASINLFVLFLVGDDKATHAFTFDFISESDLQTFMSSSGASKIAQLFSPKFDTISSPVSRYKATPVY